MNLKFQNWNFKFIFVPFSTYYLIVSYVGEPAWLCLGADYIIIKLMKDFVYLSLTLESLI